MPSPASSTPLVSVAMPAYNGASFIRQALDGALSQSYPHLEIVVVDDGSTDSTPEICREYGSRIRYYRQGNDGSRGTTARARAVIRAHGEFIAPLDQDDAWQPNTIEALIAPLLESSEFGASAGIARVVDGEGKPTGAERHPGESGDRYHEMLRRFPFTNSACLYRLEALAKVGLPVHWNSAADYEQMLRVARWYPIATVNSTVCDYRQHGESYSRGPNRMKVDLLDMLRRERGLVHPGCAECRSRLTASIREMRADVCFYYLERFHALWAEGQRTEARAALRRAWDSWPLHLLDLRRLARIATRMASSGKG